MRQHHSRQQGISLIGLLFWAVLLACAGVVVARVTPTVIEYYTIQSALNRIVKNNPTTVPAVRQEFERIKQVEYSIQSIGGADLQISKENDRIQISFAYDKEVELAGPVYLLIKYQGRSE